MRKLIEFFIDRSLLVNLFSVILIIVGSLSAYTLKKDTFPEVDFDIITIATPYPGSTPEDVEKLVTIEIEREVKEVDGIEELNALSFEGSSLLYLQVDPDYDAEEVLVDVKDAVDSVADLPEDAELPVTRLAKNSQRSIVKIAIMNDNEIVARQTAKKLRDELERLDGIAKIELDGYREEEIVIEVDPATLNQYQLTTQEIAEAVKARNLNLSAGKLETGSAEYLIRTKGEFESLEDIKNVVVRSNNTGESVKVSEVAKVGRALNSSSIIQRAQTQNAIYLNVKKKFTSDVIKVTDSVKQKTEEFFKSLEDNESRFIYVDDLSRRVRDRLGVLTENGFFGLILVICTLLLFLNLRISLMTALGAPLAFLITFVAMDSMAISLNLISMFGLILVLGMLVDDSIIVSENFYQHLEEGKSPREAAIEGSLETVMPVTATIITTMLAFGSLFFMGGIMGKFLWPVPAVVILCLIASWFECFFILPSHLADFVKLNKKHAEKRRWYEPLRDFYEKSLRFFLNRYILVTFGFMLILGSSLFLAKTMRFELFPGDDVTEFYVNVKGKVGSPLEKTTNVVKQVEALLQKSLRKNEYSTIRSIIGTQVARQGARSGSHYGALIVYLTNSNERDRSTDEIIASFKSQVGEKVLDYDFSTEKRQGGPPKGKPVEVVLKGNNLKELKSVADQVQEIVLATKGVITSELDYEDGKTQLIIDVDNAEAKRLGLSTRDVALAVRRAYAGDSITEIRETDEDIEVVLKLDEKSRGDLTSLKDLYILNNQGRRIQLSRVAKIEQDVGAFVIRRLERKRAISVYGDISRKDTTPVQAASDITPKVAKLLKEFDDISFELAGENKDTAESMFRLAKAAVMSLGAIFLVLVAMFTSLGQPLVILSAIPLGLIGVVITFKVLGLALGFMALMGVVGLVGVVVNDSIVLVNFINKFRERGFEVKEAIINAARSRFRPILLTTFTTVAGLMPIAHAPGGDPFLKPMAISFAWGLLFSTFVTLIFIPCCYLLYVKTVDLPSRFKK